nr:MAG TPA: hypothetical protein [Bacteriophage sp.]
MHSKIKGRCPQDGGVNFYSQKSYEIFLLFLRCFLYTRPTFVYWSVSKLFI